MKSLERLRGAKSGGKVAELSSYVVVSLDLKDADINCDILGWDYRHYQVTIQVGHFDVFWTSPPCTEYSRAKTNQCKQTSRCKRNSSKNFRYC